jgi:hypothetical protein
LFQINSDEKRARAPNTKCSGRSVFKDAASYREIELLDDDDDDEGEQ